MTFRRVVVALDTASPAPAMAAAIRFARALEAELVGLFVEDDDLLNVAALTAAEVGFPFPAHRTLDVGTMERALRARASVVRATLAASLAGLPVKWTFEIVRGRIATALAAIATPDDVVVVALATGAGRRALTLRGHRALQVARLYVGPPPRERLVVVAADGTPAADVARLVRALGPRHGGAAQLLLAGPDGRWAPWLRELDALLADAAVTTHARIVPEASSTAVERALASAPPGLAVVVAATPTAFAELIETLPLPLLALPEPQARTAQA